MDSGVIVIVMVYDLNGKLINIINVKLINIGFNYLIWKFDE